MERSNFKILFVCNSTASRLWRIMGVADYLRSKGNVVDIIDVGERGFNPELVPHYDLFVLQMVFDQRLIKLIKKHKKKFVFEMDDLITWVPPDHYAKEDIKKNGWNWKFGCWQAIRQADAVTITNTYLARHYSWLRLGKRAMDIIPNYVYGAFWMRGFPKKTHNTIRIGYVGGNSHVDDLKILINPLRRIMAEHPNVQFVTMGTGGNSSPEDPWVEYNNGKDIFKDLPLGRRQHYLGAQMLMYPDKLKTLGIDIGVAPVLDNKFTRSKTPIKWMEYASIKVPSVCQEFLYSSVIKQGINGFLAKTEEDYYVYLKKLVVDKELRLRMGTKAYMDVVNKHLLEKNVEQWERVYKDILK